MKVWVVYHIDYGSIELYTEDTNILETPTVKAELGYLLDGKATEYLRERADFIADIEQIRLGGTHSAYVEERITVSLQEVGEMK